jgi:hypothetical protein
MTPQQPQQQQDETLSEKQRASGSLFGGTEVYQRQQSPSKSVEACPAPITKRKPSASVLSTTKRAQAGQNGDGVYVKRARLLFAYDRTNCNYE